MTFQPAAQVNEITPDRPLAAEVDGIRVAIVLHNGEYFALDDQCSHRNIPLSDGDIVEDAIECYAHGSDFDLRTGQPRTLPATEPVAVYACRVVNDTVEVDISNPTFPAATQES